MSCNGADFDLILVDETDSTDFDAVDDWTSEALA